MDIAAFIIAGFLVGFVVGMIFTLASVNPIVDAYHAEANRWYKQAMEYLELWIASTSKRQREDKNDADWWKK